MKILYHHRTQAEDGQAVHVRSMLRAFESAGHDVFESGLVKHGAALPTPRTEADQAARSASAGRSRWGWVTRLPRFARELAEYGYNGIARSRLAADAVRFEPDFLYERYAFGNVAGVLVKDRLKLPLMLEVNSPMVLELSKTRGLSFPKLARKLEDYVFTSAERICAVSGVLRDMLVEAGVERERVIVTPNGVDLALYDYDDRAAVRAAARADLGLAAQADDVVLGFVGYYRDWHRLDVAVRALAAPELAAARLVLIGDGPARPGLEALARECGVADRLHFPGSRPHASIPRLLPAFDVALVPAINPYASPLKLHEYMAAELAILAPDQPNLREVLTPGADALLVTSGDDASFLEAVTRLVGDAAERDRLGSAARATVLARELTWDGNVKRVLSTMEPLCR